ncbi:hypothetical protein [Nocardioides acrostichi]|uniref:Uncharacterized protein n=1 Tax=Nocardioides acrostichi TaxID=2784339 RepID=A0A930V436_9ACTN|nr:hypothetical protein [Nocardioides acrostichi]MBF4163634.1 hypothetical protein [Nocardioides acrostichi]
MAKATFNIKTEATKGLHAGVGVVDLAVETVRGYVTDAGKRVTEIQKDVHGRFEDVQKSVSDFDFEPKALREQTTKFVNAQVDVLSAEAKTRRSAIESRVAELQGEAKAYPAKVQGLVDSNVATATAAYDDLAKRGEVLVARIRKQESTVATKKAAKTTTSKAKTTSTQAKKATKSTAKKTTTTAKKTAKKSAPAAKKSAKATSTAAKKTASSAATATAEAAKKVGD